VLKLWHLVLLGVLLILPSLALFRFTAWLDGRLLLGFAVVIQLSGFLSCWRDKVKAVRGKWRTPEAVLHAWEIVGGWPGTFLAQRLFRHKVSKRPYQISFWLIVLAHQYLALDFLLDWKLITLLLQKVRELV
jgi:uncharacterized membrane protein YsdA (DUF1294 family)